MASEVKRRVVFTADPEQLQRIEQVVRSGRYRSSSEFLREAIDEKLRSLWRGALAEEVERYCARSASGSDDSLIQAQAFDAVRQPRSSAAPRARS